jgi:hypothetical protein
MAKAGLLFVGTDDGVVLFSDPGGVGRWLRIGQELRGQVVRAIWPAVDTPLIVLAAVDGGGLQRSTDGGQSWRQVLDADVRGIAGHARDPRALYLGTAGGDVYRSADGGAAWNLCQREPRPAGVVKRVVVAPDEAQRLFLGVDAGGVWASGDGGANWARYGEGLPDAVVDIAAVAGRPGMLYAVAGGGLYRCAAEGARWEQLAEAPARAALELVVLAGKDPVLLLASAGGIARSDDGVGWAMVEPDEPWSGSPTVLTAVRYHIDMALAGSAGGQLAQSTDRGRSWQTLKQGLAPIRSIAAARLA